MHKQGGLGPSRRGQTKEGAMRRLGLKWSLMDFLSVLGLRLEEKEKERTIWIVVPSPEKDTDTVAHR